MSPRLAPVALCALLCAWPARAADPPHTGRVWLYAATTLRLSPGLSLTLMPGMRAEFARDTGAAAGHTLDEVFVGPNLHWRFDDLSLQLSLWYYFTGIPVAGAPDYVQTHSLEVIPTLAYRLGDLTLVSRTIFHSTVYATTYDETRLRSGYGLVIREMLLARYQALPWMAVLVADEPFFGVVEDAEAEPSLAGFWPRGVRLNRVYAGFDFKPRPSFSVSPQYVYESVFDDGGAVVSHNHYLFVTAAWTLDLMAENKK
ncbi:MAG TPA: hypothetical protein PK668_23115 [Myxococcota bacterium]|nr:hypothetical protein [Myxococcota bacterium]HRY95586.1 hypothetical protein [Myxococcota bacterium]HSA20863.1 hypothetical protein [Myxococcota bacterium]